jgi:hypothetical protein
MLDAFIIEEIKRRERLRHDSERPTIQIPLPSPDDSDEERPNQRSGNGDEDQPSRGVVVIDLCS